MTKKVLVAYASVSGSTGEVAETIGAVLAGYGALVEVRHVRHLEGVTGYSAVVLGSSIRAGRWLPEATNFLLDHAHEMQHVPVAYFTTCLTMVDATADDRRAVLAYMEPILQAAPEIEPIGIGLFAGSLDPSRQQFYAINANLAPHGDYRNWKAIKSWAAKIASRLLADAPSADGAVILRDAALSHADFAGSDLSGADLRGADLADASLRDADLSQANLGDSDLTRADLGKADLNEASLRDAGLNWADLNWANMSQADLHSANLIGADLQGANLDQANLSHATLNGANLSNANLRGANLRFADLNWANLSGADLSGADLSGATLGWANLSNANLDDVNLGNTRYNDFTEWPADFSPDEFGGRLVRLGMR